MGIILIGYNTVKLQLAWIYPAGFAILEKVNMKYPRPIIRSAVWMMGPEPGVIVHFDKGIAWLIKGSGKRLRRL
jgi:hypothetical protein